MFTENDRRLVSSPGGSRAVALPGRAIIVYPEQNFAHLIDIDPEPSDVLEDLPDKTEDWQALEYVLEKNPRLFAQFIAAHGLGK